MKKLKFRLNRTSLSLLYTSFIRPQLEYASEVWGGCSSVDSDRLEKIQLIAARIVTGLPIFSSRESLYFETGWDTLSCRRQISDRNMLPSYIKDIFPGNISYIELFYQKYTKLLFT